MKNETKSVSVSDVNRYVATLLGNDSNLLSLSVHGELTNVKLISSGHCYFALKDEHAKIDCVMFRSDVQKLTFEPKNGQKVIVSCRASLYERDGKFQLYVRSMNPLGKGDLLLAMQQLSEKLKQEGLYDASAKKPLPVFPRRIGIATAASGAVIRDIINVSRRRFPGCHLLLAPCQVQGEGAAESIAASIRKLNTIPDVDVIIVGRGGGSMEDLWAFNEEIVARAVFASSKPVISAVGHESDYTICDFVADLRAPTPSAAAELALPDQKKLSEFLNASKLRLSELLKQKVILARHRLERLASVRYLENPYERINDARMHLDKINETLSQSLLEKVRVRKEQLGRLAIRLDALSPLKVLGRGYAMATAENANTPLISVHKAAINQKIILRMKDGRLLCQVLAKEEISDGTN